MSKTYMWKKVNGSVETRLFDHDKIPDGWVDHPRKATEDQEEEPKKRRGRKPKQPE